jgi:hypothetical protein
VLQTFDSLRSTPKERGSELRAENIGQELIKIITDMMKALERDSTSANATSKIFEITQSKFWVSARDHHPEILLRHLTDAINYVHTSNTSSKEHDLIPKYHAIRVKILEELRYHYNLIRRAATHIVGEKTPADKLDDSDQSKKLQLWLGRRLELAEKELQLSSILIQSGISKQNVLTTFDHLPISVDRKANLKDRLLGVLEYMDSIRDKSPQDVIQIFNPSIELLDFAEMVYFPLSPILFLSRRDYARVYGSQDSKDTGGFAQIDSCKTLICFPNRSDFNYDFEHEYQHIVYGILQTIDIRRMDIDPEEHSESWNTIKKYDTENSFTISSMDELRRERAALYINEILANMVDGNNPQAIKEHAKSAIYNYWDRLNIGVGDSKSMLSNRIESIFDIIRGLDIHSRQKKTALRQAMRDYHRDEAYYQLVFNLTDQVFSTLDVVNRLYEGSQYNDYQKRLIAASLLQNTTPRNWSKLIKLLRQKLFAG